MTKGMRIAVGIVLVVAAGGVWFVFFSGIDIFGNQSASSNANNVITPTSAQIAPGANPATTAENANATESPNDTTNETPNDTANGDVSVMPLPPVVTSDDSAPLVARDVEVRPLPFLEGISVTDAPISPLLDEEADLEGALLEVIGQRSVNPFAPLTIVLPELELEGESFVEDPATLPAQPTAQQPTAQQPTTGIAGQPSPATATGNGFTPEGSVNIVPFEPGRVDPASLQPLEPVQVNVPPPVPQTPPPAALATVPREIPRATLPASPAILRSPAPTTPDPGLMATAASVGAPQAARVNNVAQRAAVRVPGGMASSTAVSTMQTNAAATLPTPQATPSSAVSSNVTASPAPVQAAASAPPAPAPSLLGVARPVSRPAATTTAPAAPEAAPRDGLTSFLLDNAITFTGRVSGPMSVGIFRDGSGRSFTVALGQTLPNSRVVLSNLSGQQAELRYDGSTQILTLARR